MRRRPPRYTRTDTLFPYPTRVRSFDRERYSDTPEIADFIAWAETLPDEALAPEVGIVALRDMWFNDRAKAEAMGAAPAPKARNMDGFLTAVAGLAAQVDAGPATPETNHRFHILAERNIYKHNSLKQ